MRAEGEGVGGSPLGLDSGNPGTGQRRLPAGWEPGWGRGGRPPRPVRGQRPALLSFLTDARRPGTRSERLFSPRCLSPFASESAVTQVKDKNH